MAFWIVLAVIITAIVVSQISQRTPVTPDDLIGNKHILERKHIQKVIRFIESKLKVTPVLPSGIVEFDMNTEHHPDEMDLTAAEIEVVKSYFRSNGWDVRKISLYTKNNKRNWKIPYIAIEFKAWPSEMDTIYNPNDKIKIN